VYVGVKNLGDEVHGRRNHGVLLADGDLELVNPCRVERAVWKDAVERSLGREEQKEDSPSLEFC